MGLETVEIVLDLEEHFGIQIPDQDASPCETVGDLVAVIVSLIAQQPQRQKLTTDQVFRETQAVVSETMQMPASEITMEAKWIGDITKYG